jgi:hypothetical protein
MARSIATGVALMRSVILHNCEQAQDALRWLYRELKPLLSAGKKFLVAAKEPTRTNEQNAKFHAMCEDFARCGVLWAGKRRSKIEWKELLVIGHATATRQGTEIVPGLEGEFVNLRESTAEMSVSRKSSLIDYTQAYGDSLGVQWTEPETVA